MILDLEFEMQSFEPYRHNETFLTLRETAIERRFDMPFRKTWDYSGKYLNRYHKGLVSKLHATGMIDIGIEGWLLPPDALKLYEMAFCCNGDILELGPYRGLSTSIMNQALGDSKQDSVIVSIDSDPTAVELSTAQLQSVPRSEYVHFFQDDAASAIKNLASIKRQFAFSYVNHSHRYEHMLSACEILHRVVKVGGFALFHDFNDPRNSKENELEHGVFQGVSDGLRNDRWEFWGIYGCTGLFRRIGPC